MYRDHLVLIESLKSGEESAYAYLLGLYHKRLFTYVLTLTHDHAVAEDIIQNVFLKLFEYRDRLQPDQSLQNFLYKSCYNEFINHYKKNKRLTYFDKVYLETMEAVINSNEINLLEKKKEMVFEGVSALPNKCAEVFILSKREGLTNIEISEYLNVSVKTVEGHLTKAYSILREHLGPKIVSFFFLSFK